jgi:PKD repeat protein
MFKRSTKVLARLAIIALQFTACSKDKTSPAPTVDFLASTTSTVVGSTVTFTNKSSDASLYLWKFGDGNGSTDTNATHVYDSIGTFKVTLIALSTGGIDSTSATVVVKSGNITIIEGTGIKSTSIGTTWSSIQTKYGTDTSYYSTYYSAYKEYVNEIYYGSLGLDFVFVSSSSVVSSTDALAEVLVFDPFAGTTQYGIALGSPKGNVLYYYGTPSDISTSSDALLKYYDYASTGIMFYIEISSNTVIAMEIYAVSNKKSGSILKDHNLVFRKK